MPYIRIETNTDATGAKADKVLAAIIDAVAATTGKPVKAFQGCLTGGLCMRMTGDAAPTAYVDYKSIGIDDAKVIAAALCDALRNELGVPGDKVYISFQVFERTMWGKNGTTMA